MSLEETVKETVRGCDRCMRRQGCDEPTPMTGTSRASIVALTTSPLTKSERSWTANMLRLSGLHGPDVSFMAAAACPGTFPTDGEIDACRTNLTLQLRAIRPKVIVAMGAGTHGLFRTEKLTDMRGIPYTVGKGVAWDAVVVPTWHPAFAKRKKHSQRMSPTSRLRQHVRR